MSCPTDFIASVTTASSPMPTGPTTLHWPAGSSPYPTQLHRAGRAITPKMVATTKTGMLALAAAGGSSSSRPSNPAASPASGPSPRSGSIAHEQHPVVTAPIALPVRRRYPAGNSLTLPMAPSASTSAAKTQILQHVGTGPTARTPTQITDPATHSSQQIRPRAAKSRRTSPEIPIDRHCRRRILPRGFLLRGFSDACLRAAPRAVTGRHPKTLNDSGHSWERNQPRYQTVVGSRTGVLRIQPVKLLAAESGARSLNCTSTPLRVDAWTMILDREPATAYHQRLS